MKYVTISGLKVYPYRKSSIRNLTAIDPFLPTGHHLNLYYDYNYYLEFITILTNKTGSFSQKEKHGSDTIFSIKKVDENKYILSVKCNVIVRLTQDYELTDEIINDMIEEIRKDANETQQDDEVRKEIERQKKIKNVNKYRMKANIEILNTVDKKVLNNIIAEYKNETLSCSGVFDNDKSLAMAMIKINDYISKFKLMDDMEKILKAIHIKLKYNF